MCYAAPGHPDQWAQRLKRVFAIDIETCPHCGGTLRVIASIEEPLLIAKILGHVQGAPESHLRSETNPRYLSQCLKRWLIIPMHKTVLHYSVMKNKTECVKYLLEHGANKNLKDSFGYTVFDRIQTHDHISKDIAQLLKK